MILERENVITRQKLNDFYDMFEQGFNNVPIDIDLRKIIWNCAESGLYSDSKIKSIFARRGARNFNQNSNCLKDNYTTVQVCGSAFGDYMTPFIVFKGEGVKEEWKTWNGAKYGITETGNMQNQTFIQWLEEVFIPESARYAPEGYTGPRFLILEGRATQLNINALRVAINNSIILIRLPSNTTHILQPLDVSFFGQLKNLWQNLLEDTNRQNISTPSNSDFPLLIREIWDKIKPEYITNGFRKAGIFPLNKERITDDELIIALTLPWDEDGVQCFGETQASITETLAQIRLPPNAIVPMDIDLRKLIWSCDEAAFANNL